MIDENHKEKVLVNKGRVVVALDLVAGNTKNPEYKSEYGKYCGEIAYG